jgi:hypothetical protein
MLLLFQEYKVYFITRCMFVDLSLIKARQTSIPYHFVLIKHLTISFYDSSMHTQIMFLLILFYSALPTRIIDEIDSVFFSDVDF